MKAPKNKTADVKVYGLIAAVVLFSLAYAFWPSIAQSQTAETTDLLQALLKENERLRGTQAAAPVAAAVVCASHVRPCALLAP